MVNNTSQNSNTHKNYGKNYFNIDFSYKENLSVRDYTNRSKATPNSKLGTLSIGNSTFDMTYMELEKLAETINDVKLVLKRQHSLGMLRK